MNKYIPILTDKIYELYKTYEYYTWDNPNRRIVIVLEEKNMISFYLYNLANGEELLDDVHISFDKKETALYYAIALRLFVKTLGNVMIHKLDDDMFYNVKHKSYLLYIVKNQELHKKIDSIVEKQLTEVISMDTDIVSEASEMVKNKIYSKKFLTAIDNRTRMTSDFLRGGKI